jgi:cytochrome c oxidase assembly protein subunit 11
VSRAAPGEVIGRTITVRFDANVGPGLPWKFEPEVTTMQVKIGEVVTVNYRATSLVARETVGIAAYNVAPLTVGSYFQKINCFCFTDQRLKPGEKAEMPVVFYIDPAIVKDSEQNDLNSITLSYTFFPVREPPRAVSVNAATPAPGRL